MQNPEPGWYLGKSNEEYHAGPGLSSSGIKLILRSPAHYKYSPPKEETPAMRFGTAFHTAVLEPALFAKTYVQIPADCRQGSGKGLKERQAVFAEQLTRNGQLPLSDEDLVKIQGMAKAVHAHPYISAILKDGKAEVSGFWNDLAYPQVLCKLHLLLDHEGYFPTYPVAFLRWNLFTYRDLWEWIDRPFDVHPFQQEPVQYRLWAPGLGQHSRSMAT